MAWKLLLWCCISPVKSYERIENGSSSIQQMSKKRVSGPMECLHPDFLWVFLAHTLQMSALDIENWIKTTYSTISDNRTYGFQRRTIWCCWTNFKAFNINLNVQHVNGMTHFDTEEYSGKLGYWMNRVKLRPEGSRDLLIRWKTLLSEF